MSGIFICYRREDSAGHAGRIFDRLCEQFGKDHVFMDVSGIEPGADFVEAVDSAVGSCDALVLVIGRKWLNCTDAAGKRRLDDPKDFIRLETATALRRRIRVIPVLVQDAAMPTENDLPEDILKLARRQAIEISDVHWDSDTKTLIETLAKILPGEAKPVSAGKTPEPSGVLPDPKNNRLVWLISTITAVVLALGSLLASIESVKNTFSGLFSSHPEKKIETTAPPSVPAPLETAIVPNLTGIPHEAAVAQLQQERLRVGSVNSRPADRTPGTVVGQNPAAGTRLTPDSEVHLILAERPVEHEIRPVPKPKPVAVPKLTGLSQEKARAALKKSGLLMGEIKTVESHEIKPGTVIEQIPPAGQKLAEGSAVILVVAIGPPMPVLITVPKLTGLTVAMARESLAREGLATGIIHRKVYSRARPGTVYDQKPGPGQQAPKGAEVELVIAVESVEAGAATIPKAGKVTVIVQGEPTSRRFWEGEKKPAYSTKIARLYSGILKETAPGPIAQTVNTYHERELRDLERMLRDTRRLCESTGSGIVFAATVQEANAYSDSESAYWPELQQKAIVCSSGKIYQQRNNLSPERTDLFPFEKAMTEAMQAFIREHRNLLK